MEEQVPRRGVCQYCGVYWDPATGEQRNVTQRRTHPRWHEAREGVCQACGIRIWMGDCYAEPLGDFPTDGLPWSGWGGGTWPDQMVCETCTWEQDRSDQTEMHETWAVFPN